MSFLEIDRAIPSSTVALNLHGVVFIVPVAIRPQHRHSTPHGLDVCNSQCWCKLSFPRFSVCAGIGLLMMVQTMADHAPLAPQWYEPMRWFNLHTDNPFSTHCSTLLNTYARKHFVSCAIVVFDDSPTHQSWNDNRAIRTPSVLLLLHLFQELTFCFRNSLSSFRNSIQFLETECGSWFGHHPTPK